ncbi:hypothetical protein [Caldisericum sp. AR60]|uniref:hypothetical protein n=1 Tax=Caldisericum sp. AR60 TaxID=3397852 RepID=UPI0039FD7972
MTVVENPGSLEIVFTLPDSSLSSLLMVPREWRLSKPRKTICLYLSMLPNWESS